MTPTQSVLLLTEGLGACARIAVEHRVSERAYLALASAMYRRLAGVSKGGRPAASHGAWDPLLAAMGGQAALAMSLGVSRKSVQRWIVGAVPGPDVTAEIRAVARNRKVASPV